MVNSLGEVTNIIHKAVNDDFKTPLNELIKNTYSQMDNAIRNKSKGLNVNPVFDNSLNVGFKKHYPATFLSKNQENVQIGEVTRYEVKAQLNEEVWMTYTTTSTSGNTVYNLRNLDLLTGIITDVELSSDRGDITYLYVFLITERYVYSHIKIGTSSTDVSRYLLRYDKLTGEYKISETELPSYIRGGQIIYGGSPSFGPKFTYYNGNIYLFTSNSNNNSDSYEHGLYVLTDEIDSGGSFSATRIGDTFLTYKISTYSYFNLKNIGLTDNYILIPIVNDNYLYLYKVNVLTGEYEEKIDLIIVSTKNADPKDNILLPIEHNGKVVGALFGVGNYEIHLLKINGSEVEIDDSSYFISSGFYYDTSYYDSYLACYKDGKLNLYEGYKGNLIKDANVLPVKNDMNIVFLPKGTKFYSIYTDKILKIPSYKLRDLVSVEDGVLDYTNIHCDENYMFEITEDGLYGVPIYDYIDSTYGHIWYYLGTFA